MLILLLLSSCALAPGHRWQERGDWARLFADAGVRGTVVVVDERGGGAPARWTADAARARTGFVPASTFKIPHALFALDAGIVCGRSQVFAWDGTRRDVEAWNRNQDLQSAIRNSTVWVFQGFARELGEKRERAYLRRIGYGNADPGGGIERFWLDGALRISAVEQVAFLQRLYRGDLPFRPEHMRLVKNLLEVDRGEAWVLRAKTGLAGPAGAQVGWWVGWVERPEGTVFFALNFDVADSKADPSKRQSIGRAVLRSVGALPQE